MTALLKNDKAAAEEYLRRCFTENPFMSLDQAAKKLDKEHYHKLHLSEITRIRTFAKQQLASQGKLPAIQPQIRRKEAFNAPRLTVAPEVVTVNATAEAVPQAVKQFPVSSKQDRSKFLDSWAEQHPNGTINEARKALMDHFGMAIGTAHIAETLKLARQIAGLEPKPQEKPVPVLDNEDAESARRAIAFAAERAAPGANTTSVQGIVQAMKALGLTKVEIKADGHVSFDMKT